MDPSQYQLWSLIIDAGSKILLACTGMWAVFKYRDTKAREARKPLWEKQLNLYFQACEATAMIASTPPGDPRRKAAENTFMVLYYGPMAVVEDQANVEAAMKRFMADLVAGRNNDTLMDRSVELAHACRESIRAEWDAKLDQLAAWYRPQDAAEPSTNEVPPVTPQPQGVRLSG